jgi:hypothetical protein
MRQEVQGQASDVCQTGAQAIRNGGKQEQQGQDTCLTE